MFVVITICEPDGDIKVHGPFTDGKQAYRWLENEKFTEDIKYYIREIERPGTYSLYDI